MDHDAPYRHDPNHPMNPPQPGVLRMIPVDLGNGTIEQMAENLLVRSEQETENDNEIVLAVEYRISGTGQLVHRSVHVHLKKATVIGEAVAAELG